jgi:segregation and condensation protein A
MEFTIKLDRFEGPYAKLLSLIEERKLSITEVSLSDVADEYIRYVKTLDQKDIFDISAFIVVASTLILIKTKSLLPHITYTPEEEKSVGNLEAKLELYSLLQKSGVNIRKVFGNKILHSRVRANFKKVDDPIFIPSSQITIPAFQSIAILTIATFSKVEKIAKVAVEQLLRIEDVIEKLIARVSDASTTLTNFANTVGGKDNNKTALIVSFLALLELIKNGVINAEQGEGQSEISIMKM